MVSVPTGDRVPAVHMRGYRGGLLLGLFYLHNYQLLQSSIKIFVVAHVVSVS